MSSNLFISDSGPVATLCMPPLHALNAWPVAVSRSR
eukprot:CAMPEP_0170249230 /NCGR_PEP_ID=MMETSP0116_2-20130129/24417_1 /TAXON_ID=400756 /ORGANISM="Durinskia baltica, Strain CSIRO CS-38" /LENGTH=35 /DNA_ID= /DNA_START= /DNA_END= /DNA_ORIENTATION=